MYGQPKKYSILESIINTSIGYLLGVLTQIIIFPLYGLTVSLNNMMSITAIFTMVSFLRSYILRRLFNKLHIILQKRNK
jgi:hypothetical protein